MKTLSNSLVALFSISSLLVSAQVSAIEGGQNDRYSPSTNAVVSLNESACSGTLISPTVVITSGHCFDGLITPGRPWRLKPAGHVDFSHPCRNWERPDQWYNLGDSVSVEFGNDRLNWRHTASARQYSIVGCLDIMLLRLDSAVPPQVAKPALVQTRPFPLIGRDLRMRAVGWGSTNLEELFRREAADNSPGWASDGHAHKITGMAASDGFLYAASEDNKLWRRRAGQAYANWTYVGHARNVRAMAASSGYLFAATSDNVLWARPASANDVAWERVGHANNVVAMTAEGGNLYAATSDNKLWLRQADRRSRDWRMAGEARSVTSLAASAGALYATTSDDFLWTRAADETSRPWERVTEAVRVRAMAASDGNLFGAQSALAGDTTAAKPKYRQTASGRPTGTRGCSISTRPSSYTGNPYLCLELDRAQIHPGDSGGAVLIDGGYGRLVLVGVIQREGGTFVPTNYSATNRDSIGSGDVARWIEVMADPERPSLETR